MGKVLKPVLAVASLAVIAIPGVGPAIFAGLQSIGLSAAAAAGIAGSLVSNGIMAAIGSPVANMEEVMSFSGGNVMSHLRSDASPNMPPRRGKRHWLRFRTVEMSGDCMTPHMPPGRLGLIDRGAIIRAGDMICVHTGDDFILKRFVEMTDNHIEVETTWPRQSYRIPLDKIRWAYRVRAMTKTKSGIRQAIRNIMHQPDSHQERIASIIVRDDRDVV